MIFSQRIRSLRAATFRVRSFASTGGLFLAGAALLAWGYASTLTPATIILDGVSVDVRTHQRTVGGLLRELNLPLAPEDNVTPPREHALTPALHVNVQRAQRVLLRVDGTEQLIRTHARVVSDIWRDVGIQLNPADELFLNEVPISNDYALAPIGKALAAPAFPPRVALSNLPEPSAAMTLSVRRAVPITVQDNGVPMTLFTTAATVGDALYREKFTLFLGDEVYPALNSSVQPKLRVVIHRSTPIAISVDGQTMQTRSRQRSVDEALSEQGIIVAGLDRVEPPLTTTLSANLAIRVVRVQESVHLDEQVVRFASVTVGDDQVEIDQRRVTVTGQPGIKRQRFRVRYEDNVEVNRDLEDAWVAQKPVTQVVAYGRKITPKTLDTPDGPITYWRKMRVYTTAYTAASAGTPRSAPYYGRTRIGLPLRTGIVAVDPTVIPLRSWMYVPGYGKAIAGDTGGGVKGKFVDLGYTEGEYKSWHWWTDIYLLWPPPPPHQTRWILPDHPKYPDRRR